VNARAFRDGAFDTGFIDANLEQLGAVPQPRDPVAVAAGALALVRRDHARNAEAGSVAIADLPGPWWASDGFQLVGERRTGLPLVVDGERIDGILAWDIEGPAFEMPGQEVAPGETDASIVEANEAMLVLHEGRQTRVEIHDPTAVDLEHLDAGGLIKAPMHGKLVALFVESGQKVAKGDRIAVVEAMKMEHVLTAPVSGVIGDIVAEIGAQVAEGARITVIVEEGEDA